ncbi:MAG: nucleotidyltransferase [Chitinophagaceae bacterium]
MTLEKDFADFVELLNKHDVDYMVVGGYALAFHGEPRTTGDMDIWIDCTAGNATRMMKVIKDFGMSSLGFKPGDFLEPGIITQIGYPPLRIDILNEIDGVTFQEAVKNKQYFQEGKMHIPFIGREDFIKNKETVGRKKDIEDVKRIKPRLIGKRKTRR